MTDTKTPGNTSEISLREITADTVVTICRLSDTLVEPQKRVVAPNAISIAQAHFSQHAWFRAIYAYDEPVGFIMVSSQYFGVKTCQVSSKTCFHGKFASKT